MQRLWNRLGRWADKRLPGLMLLAFVFLMSQLDSARASDIEFAPVAGNEGLSLAVLGFVCTAPLPALAVLIYGLIRARSGRPVNLPAPDRQGFRITTEYRTMRLGDFLAAAMRVLSGLPR